MSYVLAACCGVLSKFFSTRSARIVVESLPLLLASTTSLANFPVPNPVYSPCEVVGRNGQRDIFLPGNGGHYVSSLEVFSGSQRDFSGAPVTPYPNDLPILLSGCSFQNFFGPPFAHGNGIGVNVQTGTPSYLEQINIGPLYYESNKLLVDIDLTIQRNDSSQVRNIAIGGYQARTPFYVEVPQYSNQGFEGFIWQPTEGDVSAWSWFMLWQLPPPANSPPPSVLTLAKLSEDAYNRDQGADGYLFLPDLSVNNNGLTGLKANVYRNAMGDQYVVSVRGTDFDKAATYNLLSNESFVNGNPNLTFAQSVGELANMVNNVHAMHPQAEVTITGHSLGGALSQLVGKAAGIRTVTFDAPGPAALFPNLGDRLSPVMNKVIPSLNASITNYRLYGDQISLVGSQIGSVRTVDNGACQSCIDENLLNNPMLLLQYHKLGGLTGLKQALFDNAVQTDGEIGVNLTPRIVRPVDGHYDFNAAQDEVYRDIFRLLVNTGIAGAQFFDPGPGSSYLLQGDVGSPYFQSIALPIFGDVDAWYLQYRNGLGWSPLQLLTSSEPFEFGLGVDAAQFFPLDELLHPIFNQDPFAFRLTFASDGDFSGTVTANLAFPNATPEPGTFLLLILPLGVLLLQVHGRRWALQRR